MSVLDFLDKIPEDETPVDEGKETSTEGTEVPPGDPKNSDGTETPPKGSSPATPPSEGDDEPLVDSKSKGDKGKENTDSPSEQEEINPYGMLIKGIYESFGEDLGENNPFAEVDSFEGFVDFLNEFVAANATPNYSSEEVAQLDEYVRNGGNLKDFFNNAYSSYDPTEADLTDEAAQEQLIRNYLKEVSPNLASRQVDKLIKAAKEDDTLEQEAKETHEKYVKLFKEKQESTLKAQAETAKQAEQRSKQQQEQFISDVKNATKDTFGHEVSPKEKEAFINWVFKPGPDNKTGYQKAIETTPMLLPRMLYAAFSGLTSDKGKEKFTATKMASKIDELLKGKTPSSKGTDIIKGATDKNKDFNFKDHFNSFNS